MSAHDENSSEENFFDGKNFPLPEKFSEKKNLEPALYLVPTPIGNLEDITFRALRVLRDADIIACEDTRRCGQLLKLYGIPHKTLMSCHEHNERGQSEQLVKKILEGKSVAFTSDAGAPGISDPGYRIVVEAVARGAKIIPLPGANAMIPALTASGLPTDAFYFAGFPPQKKGRKTFLEKISQEEKTIILYESPYRIEKLIDELLEICGAERKISLGRELTKLHEEFIRGTLAEVKENFSKRNSIKGEFVVVLEGKREEKNY